MSKSSSLLIVGFLLGILTATIGFATLQRFNPSLTSARASTTLQLGHTLPTSHPVHRGIEKMRDRLEELSGHRMIVN